MSRPRAYDEDRVLTAAMLCFWRKGFLATSMKDLEASTGLTPGSLYNSFDSKNGLFLRVLDHYIETVARGRVQRFLEPDGDPIKGIEQYFLDCFVDRTGSVELGCLLINTSTELGPHNEAVRKKVSAGMKLAVDGLNSALVRAQASGQLSADIDTRSHATHLGLLLNGMLVNTRVASNKRWLAAAMTSVRGLLH